MLSDTDYLANKSSLKPFELLTDSARFLWQHPTCLTFTNLKSGWLRRYFPSWMRDWPHVPTNPDLCNTLTFLPSFSHCNKLLQQSRSSPFCLCLLPHEITWQGRCSLWSQNVLILYRIKAALHWVLSNKPAQCAVNQNGSRDKCQTYIHRDRHFLLYC